MAAGAGHGGGAELAEQLRGNQGIRDFVNALAAGAVGLSTTLVGLVLQGFTIGLFTFYLAACSAVATTVFRTLTGGALPARPRPLGGAGLPVRPHRRHLPGRRPAGADRPAGGAIMGPIGALLALPAAASAQALVSIYLHRYEVITDPLTSTLSPARRAP